MMMRLTREVATVRADRPGLRPCGRGRSPAGVDDFRGGIAQVAYPAPFPSPFAALSTLELERYFGKATARPSLSHT